MVALNKLNKVNDYQNAKRVLKYLLVWCEHGRTEIIIDENEFCLTQHQVITITSGQVHFFRNIQGTVYILEFTLDFICKDDNDIALIFHNGLFCHFGINEVIAIDCPQVFENLLQKIALELEDKPYQYLISVRSYIQLLLIAINRTKIAKGDEIWKPDALFLRFLEEVRNNFSLNYSVAQISDTLHTTEAKLNELSKRHTSKTAQNVIYSLIISEAKRLLIYQDLSIKEIAFQLGFKDPFYFSNFFKKHTRFSPKHYKKTFAV
ncbi:helix-turn-helix domain-containing protein [Olivibacter sp. SDN3]|uniref:helix-turn-helix domain-containing protein n=1 Tax=Olivibacter sp. SDN3 TaxID=2764720 RepID=UPI0016512ED6|nr:helix-turn-helix domain-containing protein [Olivibacter sp. SDN3]QNL51102.1 helix-turn-helix domain-containing protein [Olivibacter sp. SDN3]